MWQTLMAFGIGKQPVLSCHLGLRHAKTANLRDQSLGAIWPWSACRMTGPPAPLTVQRSQRPRRATTMVWGTPPLALTISAPIHEREPREELDISKLRMGKPHSPNQQEITEDGMTLHPSASSKHKWWNSLRRE